MARLDRTLTRLAGLSNAEARRLVVGGHVRLNRSLARDPSCPVSRFDTIVCRTQTLQEGMTRVAIMLHKPPGWVSATVDDQHPTVLDLIDHPAKASLHLAGRLDRSASGLVLLTNDGRWAERWTHPSRAVPKVYLVETTSPIPDDAEQQFGAGFWFAAEGVRTRPAVLERLGPCSARVTIIEGRWHQIKRMFHRLAGTRLASLHRERIGPFSLPVDLAPGRWRAVGGPYGPVELGL